MSGSPVRLPGGLALVPADEIGGADYPIDHRSLGWA